MAAAIFDLAITQFVARWQASTKSSCSRIPACQLHFEQSACRAKSLACFQDEEKCLVAGLVCSLAWHVEVPLDMTTFSAGLDPYRSVLCWILKSY